MNNNAGNQKPKWREIGGYPKFKISEHGLVSHQLNGIKKLRINTNGYPAVKLYSTVTKIMKWYPIHILVAAAFIGPRPSNAEIGHIDGNKENNHYSNLKYCTTKENAQDKIAHKTGPIGERSPTAKLNENKVKEIKKRVIIGSRHISNTTDLAKEFGVNHSTILKIAKGQSWKHVKID